MDAIGRRFTSWRLIGALLLLALASRDARAAPPSAAPGDPSDPRFAATPAPGGGERALRIRIEPITVDGWGTRSLGAEIADVFPGDAGVMRKSATLRSRFEGDTTRESVDLTIRAFPTLREDGDCELRVDASVKSVIARARSGRNLPPARRSTTIQIGADQERMLQIYESAATGGRLALRVRCGPRPAGALAVEDPRVDLSLTVERADGEGPFETLASKVLTTGIGRAASNLFSFNAPLPVSEEGDKRYRRERFEIRISPELLAAGRLQAALEIDGEIASVSAFAPTITHPIDHRQTAVVAPGEPRTIDLEVRSSGDEEGWSLVRYRLQMVAHFDPR